MCLHHVVDYSLSHLHKFHHQQIYFAMVVEAEGVIMVHQGLLVVRGVEVMQVLLGL